MPGQHRNVIPSFVFWAKKGQPLPITGKMTRDFTQVGDIVDAFFRAAYYEKTIREVLNIAAGREIEFLQTDTSKNLRGRNHVDERRPFESDLFSFRFRCVHDR